MGTDTGKIFNIQRFSIHDGPGIRTVVFFCGCNLSCGWCHNPEAISFKEQLEYYDERCILCGKCSDICQNNAHEFENGRHVFNRSNCVKCLKCAEYCYAESLVKVGSEMTLQELEDAVLTDKEYFIQNSEGGVTFSGGEPMLQIEFLERILKRCKNHGLHTAVDTAGFVSFEYFEKIISYCDLFLYDIKAFNSDTHKILTGVPNELILENLKKLAKIANIWVRVPVIKGSGDNLGNIHEMREIALFLKEINIKKCELLPYHKLGENKYNSLGLGYQKYDAPDEIELNQIKKIFVENGINIC